VLAIYQLGRTDIEHPKASSTDVLDHRFWRRIEDNGLRLFCTAVEARPEVVRKQARKDRPLPPRTQRVLELAQRKCFIKGGWKPNYKGQPGLGCWNDPID
jgi:hypothetical protein